MKKLTEQLKNETVLKWYEIVDDIKNKKEIQYMRKYWKACGVHKSHLIRMNEEYGEEENWPGDYCKICRLNIKKEQRIPICHIENKSVMYQVFKYADARKWLRALQYANIALDTIKRLRVDKEISKKREGKRKHE